MLRFLHLVIETAVGYRLWPKFSVFLGYLSTETQRYNSTFNVIYGSSGPYVGFSYSQPLGKGTLNAGIASARLDGTFERNSSTLREVSDAESNGVSYSLIWTAPWSQSLYYRMGLKLTGNYTEPPVSGVPRTSRQDYNSIVLGLVNHF